MGKDQIRVDVEIVKQCKHCAHSIGTHGGELYCRMWKIRPFEFCGKWMREPGIDDE